MKTILVSTDFSDYSLKAIRTAAPIANTTGAKIVLLHNAISKRNGKPCPYLNVTSILTLKKILELDKKNKLACEQALTTPSSLKEKRPYRFLILSQIVTHIFIVAYHPSVKISFPYK